MDPNQGLAKYVDNNTYWWCVSIALVVLVINNVTKWNGLLTDKTTM